MAAADVDKLAHRVIQLVERDTVDGVSGLRPGDRLALDPAHVELLEPLAQNLDLPGRLAPMMRRFTKRQDPERPDRRDPLWHDPREGARRGLTTLVARCADALEPDPQLPPPDDAEARNRLATAVSRAYAANATPRLVEHLFPNGRPDDLGLFTPPQLEGDVAAARAMAIAIGARTATREEDVLRKLVAEGHGGAAHAAADLLLKERPDFKSLPTGEQPGIRRHLARGIEAGFAVRDVREARHRELTEELENRREDVTGGAGTIDTASALATDELTKLNAFLQDIDYWQQSATTEPGLAEVRAIVTDRLVTRVEHHAGIDTSLTRAELKSPSAVSAAAADAMVATSTIPRESRPAAVQATATMLTEGFDELPQHLAIWQAEARDIPREAASYGAALGDRTMAAVRTFEHHPPEPLPDPSTRFATDPALSRPEVVPATPATSTATPRTTRPTPAQARTVPGAPSR
ncbi:hypothetical protein JOF29_006412 [Kribbella aluminosa]|uniref:DUF222 domain-containing protein n=1 Tax=Kribbella aluminosa TaxID=416017 RepID=A0ABS4UUH9_9ACTN|nr:hypothetical protein [Kribbella aluminosa]MBP2355302.1 hypothetical protein [Kribbella aluminosa]